MVQETAEDKLGDEKELSIEKETPNKNEKSVKNLKLAVSDSKATSFNNPN